MERLIAPYAVSKSVDFGSVPRQLTSEVLDGGRAISEAEEGGIASDGKPGSENSSQLSVVG